MRLTVLFLKNILSRAKRKIRNLRMNFESKNLFHFSTGKMEQKNILDPITKMLAFMTPILGCLCWFGFVVLVAVIVCVVLVLYFVAYFYCLRKMPDRLHTEKYLLTCRQMEIEQNSKYETDKAKFINVAPANTKFLPLATEEEEEKI